MQEVRRAVYFDEIHHSVTHVRKEGIFNLSSVAELEHTCGSFGFGIKYVTKGTERYRIEDKLYTVNEANFLLVNGNKTTKVEIDSKTQVKGLCIHLSQELIDEVIAFYIAPNTAFSDTSLSQFFYSDEFLESQYSAHGTLLGKQLLQLDRAIQTKNLFDDQIGSEIFYDLAIAMVKDQTPVFKQLQNIKSVKSETKKDLYRRVLKGKEFIDAHFESELTIEQIASHAGMSEFHFYRLFKQIVGLSPYQYILKIRLVKSYQLLTLGYSVSEVAFATGFSSIFTFSKSFKKMYRVSPSQYYLIEADK
jgi:AraC family transcriptional regulator